MCLVQRAVPGSEATRPGGRKIGLVRQVGVVKRCGHLMEVIFPITSNIQLILSIVIHLNRDIRTHWLVVHNLFVKCI